jgi:GntR family transcriptional regulator, rspAB operon transcriptional repressor
VTRSSLADEAYARLRAAIVHGQLAPGTAIVEQELSAMLNVSRTPIRDAITRLELEGYLERDNFRLIVHPLLRREVAETFLVRELLEGHAVALAADRISDRELERLDELVAADRQALRRRRTDELAMLNDEIHNLIMEASRNRTLTDLLKNLRSRVYGISAFVVGSLEDQRRFVEDHTALVALVRDGDGEAARALVRSHLRRARDLLVHGLEEENQADAGLGGARWLPSDLPLPGSRALRGQREARR